METREARVPAGTFPAGLGPEEGRPDAAVEPGASPRRVLVVDDDEGLRSLVARTLSRAGFEASSASSGAEAIGSALGDPGLVLVLDQRLPDMTGRDIVKALAGRGARNHFVMMTGQDDERLAVEMMKLGASDYLPKDTELVEALPAVLGRLFQRIVTERRLRAAEEALHESESLYRSLMEGVDAGIALIDPGTHRIEHVNPAAARLLGEPAGDLVGRSCRPRLCPGGEDGCPGLDSGLPRECQEGVLTRADGGQVPVLRSIRRIQVSGRERLLETFLDISERKKAEEALQRRLAEKEVLLGEVSHRVYNNLTIMSSLLSLQSAALTRPEDALGALEKSRDRILAMALAYQRLHQSDDCADIDMGDYLRDISMRLLAAHGDAARMRVQVRCDGTRLDVGAALPTGLVLNELLTNAFLHAYPGQARGVVDIGLATVDGDSCLLTVADDGIGLPEGLADTDTMGLTLARLLAKQLGGVLEGETGRGSRFSLRFRAAPARREEKAWLP